MDLYPNISLRLKTSANIFLGNLVSPNGYVVIRSPKPQTMVNPPPRAPPPTPHTHRYVLFVTPLESISMLGCTHTIDTVLETR